MKQMPIRTILSFVALLATVLSATPALAYCNNWVDGTLRRDLSAINNARQYGVTILATALPTSGSADTFTTAWLAVWPEGNANNPQGFSQVGLITYQNGIRWFAYSTLGITCDRGSQHWGNLGCRGDVNDIVGLNQWHRVELVKNTGEDFWRARVYNTANQPFDVARIPSGSNTIYRAAADFEEGYNELIDPQITGRFYLYHPQYYSGGAWQDWPKSASFPNQHNQITLQRSVNGAGVYPGSTFCNPGGSNHVYGAIPNMAGDPWYWYAGTGGTECAWLFPPITIDNPPGIPVYTGSWSHVTGVARAWNGTLSWTQIAGNKVAFSAATLNTITRVYSMAYNRGQADFRINGVLVARTNDQIGQGVRRQMARTWGANGTNNFEVSNYCCGFIDADAFIVDVPRTAATNAYYDDRHYLLRFVGTWSHPIGGPYADAQDTTLSFTRIAEDFVTFTFVGTVIQPCFSRAYNRGMVAITVDGEERAIIDLYAPGVERGYCPYYLLNAGVHTIHIANTGQKNPNSSDYFIDIDYIWVAQQ